MQYLYVISPGLFITTTDSSITEYLSRTEIPDEQALQIEEGATPIVDRDNNFIELNIDTISTTETI